ncbi:MAG: hypothetical protein F6K17_06380 [Okeania sp. SIO3C4]|nr:hypothetical protein [Okeania sp. SIO3C4]
MTAECLQLRKKEILTLDRVRKKALKKEERPKLEEKGKSEWELKNRETIINYFYYIM